MIPTAVLDSDAWAAIAPSLANHLWQSTLFAGVAMFLALLLSKNRAQTRYWIWLAASFKFVIPFSLLVSIGSQIQWSGKPAAAPRLSSAIEQISQPFALPQISSLQTPAAPAVSSTAPALVLAVWFLGCAVVLFTWCVRWRRIRRAVRAASPLPIQAPVEVMSSPTLLEPGVFGLFRAVLLLPEGIANRLPPAQLRAILAHEVCHVRRHDNLAAAIHMLVEAIFWFHPLVWWIGARMVEERERACDEEVLRLGNEPQAYAEGILNVCSFYLESPLTCASGVTGSQIKKRIEAIMTAHVSSRLTLARKLLLTAAGITAVAGPISLGVMNAPQSLAQSEALTFEVASIKPADPDARGLVLRLLPGGGLRGVNVSLKQLVEVAYHVDRTQISGGPAWLESERFDILAKPPASADTDSDVDQMAADQRKTFEDRFRRRLQGLLSKRFQLVIRRDTKEMPVFALIVAKNGAKLRESTKKRDMGAVPGKLTAEGVPMEGLAQYLTVILKRPVLDRTGLGGTYDFSLQWTPEGGDLMGKGGPSEKAEGAVATDPIGPSIFTALQEQLGLKLESQKGAVEIIVIDRAEKPSAN